AWGSGAARAPNGFCADVAWRSASAPRTTTTIMAQTRTIRRLVFMQLPVLWLVCSKDLSSMLVLIVWLSRTFDGDLVGEHGAVVRIVAVQKGLLVELLGARSTVGWTLKCQLAAGRRPDQVHRIVLLQREVDEE